MLKIEQRAIEALIPYARNSRTHSDAQIAQILPFSRIDEMGAAMYRGERISRVKKQDAGHHPALGGAVPTDTLHTSGAPCP